MSDDSQLCPICKEKAGNRCAGCKDVFYCSRAHQVQHWPTHKPKCSAAKSKAKPKPAASAKSTASIKFRPVNERPPPTLNLNAFQGQNITSKEDMMAFLEAFPKGISKDAAHERLIDCFRLFCDDAYAWNGLHFGLYNDEDPYPEFVKFIEKAKPHLPSWWTEEDTKTTLAMCRSHEWANIDCAVEKADINEHYGSGTAAMSLRMWTEKLAGSGLGGELSEQEEE
ncbi:hypothetical protein JCM10207_008523 [Rhodosporidiobolus poonsookiae]